MIRRPYLLAASFLAVLLSTVTACGQEALLPPAPEAMAETPSLPKGEPAADDAAEERWLREFKGEYTWLAGRGGRELGMHDIELSTTLALPFQPGLEPLLLTPGFAVHAWERPAVNPSAGVFDLPPRLYDTYLEIGWRPRLAEWLFTDLAVTPGLYTDFRNVNDSSFRLRGRGLGIVAFSPSFQVVAGVLYVNRNSVKVLPSAGILWSPSEATHCQLVFPQPKVSHRFFTTGRTAWWGYVAGEFGGGSWSIERADGTPDSVDYRDVRVLLGAECDTAHGVKGHVEAGYVFNRRVDYVSPTPDFKPESTLLLRAGLRY